MASKTKKAAHSITGWMPWEWLRGTVRKPSSVDVFLEVSKSIILDVRTKVHIKNFEKIDKKIDSI